MKPILPPHAHVLLMFLFLSFSLYMTVEGVRVWRRRTRLTSGQIRRRVAGAVLIETVLVMWIAVDAVTLAWAPERKLLYLFSTVLMMLGAVFLALREASFVFQQYVLARRDLFRQAVDEMRDAEVSRRRE